MFRHILTSALRNMAANRLLSAITILGLVIGIVAVLITGSLIRGLYTADESIPGYERTFAIAMPQQGRAPFDLSIDPGISPLLQANIPEIESSARMMSRSAEVQRGNVTATENVTWADPTLLAVLPKPFFRGDAQSALARPDSIAITRALARKYFGHDDVLGQVIVVGGVPMTIGAVLQDPPAQSNLPGYILASALLSQSPLKAAANLNLRSPLSNSRVYIRLKPNATVEAVQKKAHDVLAAALAVLSPKDRAKYADAPLFVRIDRIQVSEKLNPGVQADILMALAIGVLLLFIASVNFVNLMTARASRRGIEVGMRKVGGAGRPALILQFLGEAIVVVLISTCIGLAITEWLLSNVAFLGENAAPLYYWRDPPLLAALLLGVILLGVLAGAWPAFVLSSFRPANVFRGITSGIGRAGLIRNGLVVLQFAILIFFTVAAIMLYQQQLFVRSQPLGFDIDRMLAIQDACRPALRSELRKLPGIGEMSCTSSDFLAPNTTQSFAHKGATMTMRVGSADWDAFALYGIRPLAGSLAVADSGNSAPGTGIVLNQSAVRRLGFTSAEAAVGQVLAETGELSGQPVAAVVPDFSLNFAEPIQPTIYVKSGLSNGGDTLNVRLAGQKVSETLAAIDRVWKETGNAGAVRRSFVERPPYGNLTSTALLFGGCALVAVFLACLGLTGLSIATADRRTKEIGIRKAMGANSSTIVGMLLFQFSKPVLWASLLGWPAAAWWMNDFLADYVHHVSLQPWVFLMASMMALLIALTTVAAHAVWAARAKPVLALRYE